MTVIDEKVMYLKSHVMWLMLALDAISHTVKLSDE